MILFQNFLKIYNLISINEFFLKLFKIKKNSDTNVIRAYS